MVGRITALAIALLGCSVSAENDVANPGGATGSGGSTASGGSPSTGSGATGGSPGSPESCNGLDDDGDGQIDEDCACTPGETQDCYPGPASPPAGCYWGKQTCQGPDWASAACQGATLPPADQTVCCSVTGAKEHPLLDAFMATYPVTQLPKTVNDIKAFSPTANGHAVKWSQSVSGGEIIDPNNGGVIAANIELGRDAARAAALLQLPAGATIIDTKQPPVALEPLTGSGSCAALGWGWGSLLFETPSHAVGEVVYLYIGYCSAFGADGVKISGVHGDVEGFFVSDAPAELCQEPRIPVPS